VLFPRFGLAQQRLAIFDGDKSVGRVQIGLAIHDDWSGDS